MIVLAGLSFINYILLKAYSTKGLYYSALLGGAVNSSAAAGEISQAVRSASSLKPYALGILLMITIAMFIRNLVLLGLLAPPEALPIALTPLLGMAGVALWFVWRTRKKHEPGTSPVRPLQVTSPVSLKRVLKFGALFVVLQAAGAIGQRFLGAAGLFTVSFLGGFASSASATAAAAKLASQGKITADITGVATVITSIASRAQSFFV